MATELQKLGIIDKFDMNEEGKLFINHDGYEDGETVLEPGMAEIDMECKHPNFVSFLASAFWPHVKLYSFADILKFIAIHMYGLTSEQVYGADKKTLTEYTYKQLKLVVPSKYFPRSCNDLNECVTARQFLQYLGDTLRALNDNCFTTPVMNQIQNEQVPFAMITDVRRKMEVDAIQAIGGKVLFLTRKPFSDTHRIENEFANIAAPEEYFDFVIDNSEMTVAQKNVSIFSELKSIGWL